MTILNNGFHDLAPVEAQPRQPRRPAAAGREKPAVNGHRPQRPDQEFLRRCAWEIGEGHPADAYTPPESHVGLAMVCPAEGFAHWRILPEWVDRTARQKGHAWHHCRPVLRLYDVSFIHFNGFNAHRIQDHTLPRLEGQLFFRLPRPGTWQLAEVGFLLRNGEFVPAARSRAVAFAPNTGSSRGSHAALLVDGQGGVEEVGNLWEQERILRERRQPRLRRPLRLAAFAFAALASGQDGPAARFVSELAAGQAAQGHEAHLFIPASDALPEPRQVDGVHYHPLPVGPEGTPVERALAFGRAAEDRLRDLPPFDLVHLHEWMTGLVSRPGTCPVVLSLGSIEATRRNGAPASALSREIEAAEREAVQSANCVLTPDWLRTRAVAELRLPAGRVLAFPMEGRMANEWEAPLDCGQVKMGFGVGPLDRLMLYIGPLEHASGVDLLVEALPVLLQRYPNLRLAYAGYGDLYNPLQHRAHQLGVAHAVRLLGHVEGPALTRLLRSAEALVLPSRWRVPFDDAVVDLARRAGRPVVTTHGGPAHLVRHEENGVITYDNPGSMVWAVDRVLGDPAHAERMGANGRRREDGAVVWSDVARHYLELCAASFPELTETRW
jgi:glycosyltransferase involved in cell wall biosynthesis